MSSLSKTAKDIVRNIVILGAAEVVLGAVFVAVVFDSSFIPGHILGIVIGTAISAVRIMHLEKSLNTSIELGDRIASARYFRFQYFLRTLLTAGMLGVAFWLHPIVNIASVAIGLFNTPIGTHIYKLFNKNNDG